MLHTSVHHVSVISFTSSIPIRYLNREVAEELWDSIGEVDKSTTSSDVERGSFLRVQAKVDISQPLSRGKRFALEDDSEERVMNFKYEHLPNICYWCGCLNHFDKDCDLWIESEGTLTQDDQAYGPWIDASSSLSIRNSVVVVPGYYEARKRKLMRENSYGVEGKLADERAPPATENSKDQNEGINEDINVVVTGGKKI